MQQQVQSQRQRAWLTSEAAEVDTLVATDGGRIDVTDVTRDQFPAIRRIRTLLHHRAEPHRPDGDVGSTSSCPIRQRRWGRSRIRSVSTGVRGQRNRLPGQPLVRRRAGRWRFPAEPAPGPGWPETGLSKPKHTRNASIATGIHAPADR